MIGTMRVMTGSFMGYCGVDGAYTEGIMRRGRMFIVLKRAPCARISRYEDCFFVLDGSQVFRLCEINLVSLTEPVSA